MNLFDMPELMPGAEPSATPAQREEFEQRCRMLHRTEVSEELEHVTNLRVAAGSDVSSSQLEVMFPALDPALVRTLSSEAPTPQHAIELLLALSAATAEPVAGAEAPVRPASPPPLNLCVEDHDKFPVLSDSNGWQVASRHQLERNEDEDLGSAWRDRAKAAKDIPAPRPTMATTAVPSRRRPDKPQDCSGDTEKAEIFLTEYEHRHRAGQRRALRRAQYGRGVRGANGSGRGAGHQAGQNSSVRKADAESTDGDSESEASEALDPIGSGNGN